MMMHSRLLAGACLALALLPLPPLTLSAADLAEPVNQDQTSTDGPPIQRWTMDGGMRVLFVQTEALPLVDISLLFDAGSARDGGLPGLAGLTSSLLSEGAAGLDAGAMARRFEDQGAQFSAGSGRDTTAVSLRSLSDPETLQAAVAALADAVGRPTFSEAAIDRERQHALVALDRAQRNPGAIAQRAFWEAAYASHPYASPPEGTEDSLQAIRPAHIRDFHARYYVGANATLALVGDISREQAHALAQMLAEAMPAGDKPAALPTATLPETGRTVRIAFQSSQSHIYMGHPAYARGDDDHFPLYVGNHILGGNGLSSRLAEEMREQRGLSYSVSSSFNPMQAAGPFLINTQVRTDRTAEAREVLLDALQAIRQQGPTAAEVDDAVRNITGSFPLNLDSNSKIASYVASIGFYGMPLDYLDTFSARVEAVSLEAIGSTFRNRLDPDRLITVIVGPEED